MSGGTVSEAAGGAVSDAGRPMVRTVLGDVPASALGVCDAHDHLFFRSQRFPADQALDDPEAATAELRAFAELGGGTLVQWTPFGLNRRADQLVRASRATGVRVVAATGLHQAAHYPDGVVRRATEEGLAELFIRELTVGLADGLTDGLTDGLVGDPAGGPVGESGSARAVPVRAGMIKVAGSFHGLDTHARTVLTAAAAAHHATGAPIGVHLEHGTAGPDVLDLLCDRLAVPAERVLLGHLNRFPESRTHLDLAERGAFLGFDGPSFANQATDWRLLDVLSALVQAGHAGQLLLGGDTTSAQARSSNGGPGVPYLLARLRPRVERELGAEVAEQLLVANPARAFAVRWPSARS
jgi:5-phospho-D-xylono-1,4-lactonase